MDKMKVLLLFCLLTSCAHVSNQPGLLQSTIKRFLLLVLNLYELLVRLCDVLQKHFGGSFSDTLMDEIFDVEESVLESDSTYIPSVSNGKSLYEGNCTSCHVFGQEESYPDLVGVTKRRKNDWLKQWIQNPSKMIDRHIR